MFITRNLIQKFHDLDIFLKLLCSFSCTKMCLTSDKLDYCYLNVTNDAQIYRYLLATCSCGFANQFPDKEHLIEKIKEFHQLLLKTGTVNK